MAKKASRPRAAGRASRPAPAVYCVKVILEHDKSIWRRIEVRGDQTLEDLHNSIFDAFDREEEHLYSFYFPPAGRFSRKALRDAPEYTHPACADDRGPWATRELGDASATLVGQLGLVPRQRFYYLFDFGDDWWHGIQVESTDGADEGVDYPRIVEKHGQSPPQYQDCDDTDQDSDDDEDE